MARVCSTGLTTGASTLMAPPGTPFLEPLGKQLEDYEVGAA
jgi:hypothetical protein